MEVDELRWKEGRTYVVEVLGEEHSTWRMQGSKMSGDAATWGSKIALKIRLGRRRHKSLKHLPIWENFGSQIIKFVFRRTQALLI